MALYPIVFHPIFKERVWGGRALERLYRKPLPPSAPIGESWEVSDRPGDESVIANGPLAGRTLRWLMDAHGPELLGAAATAIGGRFPLLCKILDAREKLSLQVHPPARAAHLGDPKTEMWYIAAAEPGAELFVGLKRGITRQAFEAAIREGRVADCFHRVAVRAGDTMFLPSGRVHAIGAGLVIFEIQQNSDTTFRVYDWDRAGLDGKPRALHIEESLASIDFDDVEPSLAGDDSITDDVFRRRPLVRDALFQADLIEASDAGALPFESDIVRVIAVTDGAVGVEGSGVSVTVRAGNFAVVPAATRDAEITAGRGARFLVIEPGMSGQVEASCGRERGRV
ncbi:MAG TPA: type I phosphomannose isomerase catalytic subunit [Vicinamibacterales bacterium]|nr:type I phosphomannose isomerase catalytic subunit [Vicinamibacterales bacterium]